MMKKVDEILEVDSSLPFKMPVQKLVNTGQAVVEKENYNGLDDAEKDYEYQRENFYKLVEKGNAAIEGILELAKESEHPRTYEVAGNLIKQVSEVTEKLGDLQEKMNQCGIIFDGVTRSR